MKTSIHADAFTGMQDPEKMIRSAAELGVDGVEFTIGPDGAMSYDSPREMWSELRSVSTRAGVTVAALHAGGFTDSHFASADPALRQLAMQRVVIGLERAHWCGASALIVSPAGPPSLSEEGVPGEEMYARVLDAMRQVRFKTLPYAVCIACDLVRDGLIATPTEARRFIDEINSPFVGIALNLQQRCVAACPTDWVRALGHRLAWLSVDESPSAASPAANTEERKDDPIIDPLRDALDFVRYEGYVAACVPGDPTESMRRLRRFRGRAD